MYKKILAVMCAAAITAVLASCGNGAAAVTAGAEDDTIFGRVTAVDGNEITLSTFTMQGSAQGAPGTGQTPPDNVQGGQVPPDNAQGGQAPSFPGGNGSAGEEKTITVTDVTAITKGNADGSEAASLSDITVGSMISVVLNGDTAVSVTIMNGGFRGSQDINSSATPVT